MVPGLAGNVFEGLPGLTRLFGPFTGRIDTILSSGLPGFGLGFAIGLPGLGFGFGFGLDLSGFGFGPKEGRPGLILGIGIKVPPGFDFGLGLAPGPGRASAVGLALGLGLGLAPCPDLGLGALLGLLSSSKLFAGFRFFIFVLYATVKSP